MKAIVAFIVIGLVFYHIRQTRSQQFLDKRADLCRLGYMDMVEIVDDSDCITGHYLDKCGNKRCLKGYGEKCGTFVGASNTQHLILGKCAPCLYCSVDGICQGLVSPDFCQHSTSSKRAHGQLSMAVQQASTEDWAPPFIIKKMFGLSEADEMK